VSWNSLESERNKGGVTGAPLVMLLPDRICMIPRASRRPPGSSEASEHRRGARALSARGATEPRGRGLRVSAPALPPPRRWRPSGTPQGYTAPLPLSQLLFPFLFSRNLDFGGGARPTAKAKRGSS
jgi:hypothetical protein